MSKSFGKSKKKIYMEKCILGKVCAIPKIVSIFFTALAVRIFMVR